MNHVTLFGHTYITKTRKMEDLVLFPLHIFHQINFYGVTSSRTPWWTWCMYFWYQPILGFLNQYVWLWSDKPTVSFYSCWAKIKLWSDLKLRIIPFWNYLVLVCVYIGWLLDQCVYLWNDKQAVSNNTDKNNS